MLKTYRFVCTVIALLTLTSLIQAQDSPLLPGSDKPPEGWATAAPRDEIRPAFGFDSRGGPDGKGAFIIRADKRDGIAGYWHKSFPVTGGKSYRFTAQYRTESVDVPRRSVLAEIHWRDAKGKRVPLDAPAVTGYL